MDKKLKVLIIDHDDSERMAVRRALSESSIPVELFEGKDCSEAAETLNKTMLDCVLLNHRLPDGDGPALIQQFRQWGIRIPLIVLTGSIEEERAVDLMKAGATDCLAKSGLSPERLSQVLRNAIRISQAEWKAELANQLLREKNELLIRKNQELEIRRQQIELQHVKLMEASQLKSQFLATVSHELCTPLNAIIGFSQVLLRSEGLLSAQHRRMLERVLNNGKHLAILVNEILNFSKLETGHLDIRPEEFDLRVVVCSVVAELRSLANDKKLCLEVCIDLKNPYVFHDPRRIRQVLINLVSNAVKFTESGKVSIQVSESASERVAIAIHDTGIGIAPADINCIFEPFRQIDQTTTRKYPGTGLGLAIVKSLMRIMQGRIVVESLVNRGSTFVIELPRRISTVNFQS